MANTPQVIQKDLGLVTAYGYALAGGYQGTEAEFITDFTRLMNGRVHSDYTFDTIAQMNAAILAGQVEENATIYCKEEKGNNNMQVRILPTRTDLFDGRGQVLVETSILVYGNITYLRNVVTALEDIEWSGVVGSMWFFCDYDKHNPGDDIDYILSPESVGVPQGSSAHDLYTCGLVSIDYSNYNYPFRNKLVYTFYQYDDHTAEENPRIYICYGLENASGEKINIPKDSQFAINHVFINRIGHEFDNV